MTLPTTTPLRPALRYHGGKWTLASWLHTFMHVPHDHYAELCGGGASILLTKPRTSIETYNDLNRDVTRFFRTLREHPTELIRSLELTPWSREEYQDALEPLASLPDVEAARRYVVRSWQQLGMGLSTARNSWRFEKNASTWLCSARVWGRDGAFDHILTIAARLRGVQIENMDVFTLAPRLDTPTTLYYLDPPYVLSTLSTGKGRRAYESVWSDEKHKEFCELIRTLTGFVIVSGYQSPLYQEQLEEYGWVRHDCQKHTVTNGSSRTESVWLNPRLTQELREGAPLFGGAS